MIRPSVHLNGSSREALLDQYTTAARAVGCAIESLCDAAPNGRDYYPQGDNAIATARREHEARVLALRKVQEDMMEIMRHVRRSGREGEEE